MGVAQSFVCDPIPDLAWYDQAPERFVLEQELACSPAALFGIFEDPVAWGLWVTDISRVEWTSPRPFGPGTTRTVDVRFGLTVTERFLAWEPGVCMAFMFVTATRRVWRRMGERYEVTDLGAGRCRLRWTMAYEPMGWFAALHPMIRPFMRRALADTLKRLAALVDAGAGKHAVSPVSKTALWTAVARARDAAGPSPIAGDTLAARFVDAGDDPLVRELLALRRPTESIPVRHAMISEVIDRALTEHPDGLVLILGAGLDTRAYRSAHGRYVEVDQPALLAWKEIRLPARECPRPLERLGVDFEHDSLSEQLAPLATDAPVVVVAEGLLPYLPPSAVADLIATLAALFPNHRLVADLLSARFVARYGGELRPVFARHGLAFRTHPESPRALFEDAGYGSVETLLPLERSMRPGRLLRWLLRDLFEGNVICVATRWEMVGETQAAPDRSRPRQ